MSKFIIKRTGINSASPQALKTFDELCNKYNIPSVSIIVTDDEHELLSPDTIVPFTVSVLKRQYNSVMEAYNNLSKRDNELYNINLMYLLNYDKFEQNSDAQQMLLDTKVPLVYKSNDNYWGSEVPKFTGSNLVGHILVNIREQFRNPGYGYRII